MITNFYIYFLRRLLLLYNDNLFILIFLITDYSCPYTPISTNSIAVESTGLLNGSQESFWSPSMVVSAHSPPPPNSLQATPISQYDSKSTPSTPGGGLGNVIATSSGAVRSRTSPPEAAVEATPETTPVKVAIVQF